MAPDHGSLSSKVASHGYHVTVSCDPGYVLSGGNILVCSSGSWSGTVGACVKDEGTVFIIWAALQQNLSLGFLTKQVSNQYPQLPRLARKVRFHL